MTQGNDDLEMDTERVDQGKVGRFDWRIFKDLVTVIAEDESMTSDHISVPFADEPNTVELNPDDPFEYALIRIVEMNRKKRRDYSEDGSPFSNFELSSNMLAIDGFGPREAAYFNVLQKAARLTSLRLNGRMDDVANESVTDTYLDLAVYGVITYALHLIEVESDD